MSAVYNSEQEKKKRRLILELYIMRLCVSVPTTTASAEIIMYMHVISSVRLRGVLSNVIASLLLSSPASLSNLRCTRSWGRDCEWHSSAIFLYILCAQCGLTAADVRT